VIRAQSGEALLIAAKASVLAHFTFTNADKRRGGAGFPLAQRLPVLRQFFREKLERNETAQSGVFGLVDDTHATAAKPKKPSGIRPL
jgi:hypothetical protein